MSSSYSAFGHRRGRRIDVRPPATALPQGWSRWLPPGAAVAAIALAIVMGVPAQPEQARVQAPIASLDAVLR